MKQNQGYIILLHTLLFAAIALIMIVGVSNPVVSHYQATKAFIASNQSYIAANSAINDAFYRFAKSWSVGTNEILPFGYASSSISTSYAGGITTITAIASSTDFYRNVKMELIRGTGVSFHYGIQSGQGGFEMSQSSSVTGNVFSAGPITGTGNIIRGDVISAGPAGLINDIHATGTAFAHTIQNSTIDRSAYYNTLTNTTVGGTKYPNSPDQPLAPLPITDEQIAEWESQTLTDIKTCTNGAYTISASSTLGNTKIPCDLNINGTAGGYKITVTGPIWVEGNITLSQKATIAMSPLLGSTNVAIIADNPSASTTSGTITLSNTSTFEGSGASGSWVFMISQNSSAENGGTVNAVSVGQSSSALVAYAIHGLIALAQSVNLKEATAYKISLSQSANVTYDTGLPNALFSSGPSGGYDIVSWYEY